MGRILHAFIAAVALTGLSGVVNAATPLVDVDWIRANAGKAGVVIVDLRGKIDYLKGHIPGAVNTSYGRDGWRVKNKAGTVGMFPSDPKKFARLLDTIGRLGIDNDTHVIAVPYGRRAGDMGAATRVYWTFKVLGHDNVSILNGGMAAYVKAKKADGKTPINPVQKGTVRNPVKAFTPNLRKEMLIGRAEVTKALAGGVALLDARPNVQYIGLQKSGAVKRPGTLPGATNVPAEWLTENAGGMIRGTGALARLYEIAGAATRGRQLTFCNTGHWASLTWFVSSEILGNKQAQMYDGSLADWTVDKGAPMETKIKLN